MPINLIDYTGVPEGQKGRSLGGLSDDVWEMPTQVEALESWLIQNQNTLPPGSYVADIGFSPRDGACGGGAVISLEAMRIMLKLGMVLFLSEYPSISEE